MSFHVCFLSKPTSELEKELEKRRGKPAHSNNKSPMTIDNQQVQVKKELSNGSLKEKGKYGSNIPDNKREHFASISVPSNNSSVKHMTSFVGPSSNSSLKNVASNAQLSSNGSLKPVKLGEDGGNNKRENGTVKEVTKDVKQENDITSEVC